MTEENLKQIRELMKQERFTEEQIKQYEIRMLLSEEKLFEEQREEDIEIVSIEDLKEE